MDTDGWQQDDGLDADMDPEAEDDLDADTEAELHAQTVQQVQVGLAVALLRTFVTAVWMKQAQWRLCTHNC